MDFSVAKAAMTEAAAICEDSAAFSKESEDLETKIAAIDEAIAAISQGQAWAIWQSQTASVLTNMLENHLILPIWVSDRAALAAFLTESSKFVESKGYARCPVHMRDILKQMSATIKSIL